MSMFSSDPQWQEASAHSDGPGWPQPICNFWKRPEPLLHFTAPKRCREQNVGDRPQQVVQACRREGRAEHHHDS